MPDGSNKASRSTWDEMEDGLMNSVVTPAETFFLALFVLGVLTVAATTLVGTCGNVDDYEKEVTDRSFDIVQGSTAVLRQSVVLEDTAIGRGTCVIVERINEEENTVYAHALAKSQPFFTGDEREYRPLSPFENFFKAPVSTILFLHEGTPKGDIPLPLLLPVETQTYTSWFRNFYLNGIYVAMAILGVLLAFLVYIGARFEKKRKQWYKWHTLRATYISRLMHDKEKTRELQENWEKISAIVEGERVTEWDEALTLMQETLNGVLVLLQFEGENLEDRLQNMKEEDLWCIEKLWEANSLIMRAKKQVAEDEESPVITDKILKKVTEIYMTAFIWLGLLPHHFAIKGDE